MADFSTLDHLIVDSQNVLYRQAAAQVSQQGRTLYTRFVQCDADTLFDLASVSKLITGTLALMLATQKKLSLDTPVLDLLGEHATGRFTRATLQNVTPAHLLAHHAGLPAWYPFYTADPAEGFWPVLETALASQPPVAGTVYSDLGFMLLGKAVEVAGSAPLPTLVDGLNELLKTNFCYNPTLRDRCVATEFGNRIEKAMCDQRGLSFSGWRPDDRPIKGEVNDGNAYYFLGGVSGHAGIFGHPADLLTLASLYLNEGQFAGSERIKPSLVRRSLSDQGFGRGLMWDLSKTFPHGAGHTGFTGTALWICPPKKTAAALLASRLAMPGPPDLNPWRSRCFQAVYSAVSAESG